MKKIILALICLATMMFAKVDINSATVQELQTLKGVGEKKAQEIVDYRTKNGAFKSVDDLAKVKGIGKKILDDNKNELEVKPAASQDPVASPAKTTK